MHYFRMKNYKIIIRAACVSKRWNVLFDDAEVWKNIWNSSVSKLNHPQQVCAKTYKRSWCLHFGIEKSIPANANSILHKLECCYYLNQIEESNVSTFIKAEELQTLFQTTREIISKEPMILQLQSPISIAANFHGYFGDMLKVFKLGGE